MSFEGLKGTTRAFDEDIHKARPHAGQIKVAKHLRLLLHSETNRSEISENSKPRVQDSYTLRCVPQVHGIVYDTIDFVRNILTVEVNSGTDNPMVFADRQEIISGGNFHGEYPAKALDYLAIGIHEIANMSERRIERLINPAYSELPAFLVTEGGLNSGMMMAHVTAAALAEFRTCRTPPPFQRIKFSAILPVSTLSQPVLVRRTTFPWAGVCKEGLKVVEHVEQVLAIELISACLAVEYHRPLKTTEPLEKVLALVRSTVDPWPKDRYLAPDIEEVTKLIREGKIWKIMKPYIEETRVNGLNTASHLNGNQHGETLIR
ncbi:HAL [Bugula neritina]|uniref:HAL n=1 Tax=Bugula neritina TaxID=10212 RepID=A0A7J7JKE4_BUGNE|nr:HAL [Bugula neritina]